MGVEKILDDLNRSYAGLQHLNIEATLTNISIIQDTLNTLKGAFDLIKELITPKEEPKKEAGENDA